MMKNIISIWLFLLSSVLVMAQEKALWNENKKEEFSKRNDNIDSLNYSQLENDLESLKSNTWPTKPAISNYPSPVAHYNWGYCALRPLELFVENKKITGYSIAYARDKYNEHDFKEKDKFYYNYFNILILSDISEDTSSAAHAVSRNYPHYLSTGKQLTTMGSIDWVQMKLADGQNFAIVNQRYFDLNYGSTLLVCPINDGSLRFRQIELNIGEVPKDILSTESKNDFQSFKTELSKNETVLNFFNQENSIDNK